MNTSNSKFKFWIILSIILVVAAFRLLPHLYSFSTLGAVSLFGGAHFYKKWQAFLVPLFAVWLSDLAINNIVYSHYGEGFTWFYSGFYWQYISYIIIVLIGSTMAKKVTVSKVLVGSIMATIVFFLISNFGAWIGNPIYPQSFSGLGASYLAGIPFLKNSLVSQLLYSGVMFGGYYLAQRKFTFLANN